MPPPPFAHAAALDAIYGAGAAARVAGAKVLVVGAGGVGCEVVKNLASSGFTAITLLDMDTIDVSNLNRQFLFRRRHVGGMKSNVAADVVHGMVGGVKVTAVVGDVTEARFGPAFIEGFSVVLNALDNLVARRHVNRLCLAAGVVLVESGSTGYNGQATVIGRGVECYDCIDRPLAKSFAVCTIRSTPDKPVHCIVWAKHLWALVFGKDDDGNVLADLDGGGSGGGKEAGEGAVESSAGESGKEKAAESGTGENGKEKAAESGAGENGKEKVAESGTGESVKEKAESGTGENGAAENGAAAKVAGAAADAGGEGKKVKAKRVRFVPGEVPAGFASRVAERVFFDDINEQIAMKSLWEKDGRTPPTPYQIPADIAAAAAATDVSTLDLLEPRVWDRDESAKVLIAVLERVARDRSAEIGSLVFDKDDRDALAFVVAASNLRSAAFGVDLQSPFAVKGIAGNIVHAIATTNAMVAGLAVLETIKVVVAEGDGDAKIAKGLATFVRSTPSGADPVNGAAPRRRFILLPEALKKPNPACYVCSKGTLSLSVDLESMTLGAVVKDVIRGPLGVSEPNISVEAGSLHNILFESGEGLEEDEVEDYEKNLRRTLAELGFVDGCTLSVEDQTQNFSCSVLVKNVKLEKKEGADAGEEDTPTFRLEGAVGTGGPAGGKEEDKEQENGNDDGNDSDCFVVEEDDEEEGEVEAAGEQVGGGGTKRALEEEVVVVDADESRKAKKARVGDGEVVNVNEDGDEIVELD